MFAMSEYAKGKTVEYNTTLYLYKILTSSNFACQLIYYSKTGTLSFIAKLGNEFN
jgi:hypothetical protein